MTAESPQWVWVIVGRFYTLAFWVDPTQSFAVVLQEILGAALSRYLVLHEGADLFVAVAFYRDRKEQIFEKYRSDDISRLIK